MFLIQNKYYDTSTALKLDYIQNTFLLTPISVLKNGTYNKSTELQEIYNKYKDDEKFTIHLHLYVTNDMKSDSIMQAIQKYNLKNSPKVIARIYYLSDIVSLWWNEPKRITKTLSVYVETVNKGTVLNINNDDYKLSNVIDAKYVFAPITCIYRMMKAAKDKDYALFDKNIREYLGNKGINKNIYKTLKDPKERKNFFYYNNGITIICDRMGAMENVHKPSLNEHIQMRFKIENPQIVNGCQTVNSIFQALNDYTSDEDIEREFKDTFVMIKILEIDPNSEEQKSLSQHIVRYNNSQNSIDEKTFVANQEVYQRLKEQFEEKGFLLLTKQSDKNTFAEKYKKSSDLSKLKLKNVEMLHLFGLDGLNKLADFYIPLEKLLQVVLAFKSNGHDAFVLKKDVLKPDTDSYNKVTEFIKSSSVTTDTLLRLYLLYMRSEKEKNMLSRTDTYGNVTTPISFYLIDAFSIYECNNDPEKIIANLSQADKIQDLIKTYTFVFFSYVKTYSQKGIEYIKMIKSDIDYVLLASCRETALSAKLLLK